MSPLSKLIGVGILYFSASVNAACKSVPGSSDWPTEQDWAALNETLGGQLIKTLAPGAVCHPDQPAYNPTVCPTVETEFTTFPFHRDDPVSVAWNEWNNDTCLPDPQYTCSALGYPSYVVNATTAEHVAAGVKFAGSNNIRLIVKATGHDFLGRSSAPNSLSIWVRYIEGITLNDAFKPTGCSSAIETTAVTTGAGQVLGELYDAVWAKGLTIIAGMHPGIGLGGYLTGGGMGALTVEHGLAADNILELTVVTPSGDIITANECQNTDYFYAFRGGGGSTFGVFTSVVLQTIPSMAVNQINLAISSAAGATDDYWDAMTYIVTQYPTLSNNSITGFPAILPTSNVSTYSGAFHELSSPYNDTSKITASFEPIVQHIATTWPSLVVSNTTISYSTFEQYWNVNRDNHTLAGRDTLLGSRLLGPETLNGNVTALKTALKGFSNGNPISPLLLGGKGVADPPSLRGSDGVNSAWRTAITHVLFSFGLDWAPQNETARLATQTAVTDQVQHLRDLAPDSGAYLNEANPNEPDFQQSFWGSNYAKLAQIKKSVDPNDVFWCHPCVGNEGWEEVGDALCTV